MYQEPKAQHWRAIATMTDGSESLIFVGATITHVRENYVAPWTELFTPEGKTNTEQILLQKWIGSPDCGGWLTQTDLVIPPR